MSKQARALALLALASFAGMSSWFSAAAILPQLVTRVGVAPGQGAWLTMAVQLGFVVGALLSAALTLADVLAPRRLIFVGGLIAAAGNLSLLWAGTLSAALPGRVAVGAGLALVYPPFVKVVATWFREGRGMALGVLLGALTLGTAAPHLARALGGGADWQIVVVATSILSALGGVMAVTVCRDGPYAFQRGRFEPRASLRIVRQRGVRLAAFGYFGHMWELYAMWAWMPAYIGERMIGAGWSSAAGSAVSFAAIAVGAFGCYLGGRLGDGWGRTRVTTLAMACSGAAALLVGWEAMPLGVVLVLCFVWGFWVNADSAQFTAMVSEVGDQRYVGTAVTLQLALGFLLTNVTLYVVPLVHEAVGWGPAFALLAAGPLAGVVAMRTLAAAPEARLIAGGRG